MKMKRSRSDMVSPLAITYHHCRGVGDAEFPGLAGVAPETFAWQIARLSERVEARTVRDCVKPGASSADASSADRLVASLTFDDGLACTFRHAFPVIKKAGLNAVVYVCTAPLLEGAVLDVHKVHILLGRIGYERFRDSAFELLSAEGFDRPALSGRPGGGMRSSRYDLVPVRALKNYLNFELPLPVRARILSRMLERFVGPEKEIAKRFYMQRDELLRWRDAGFEIGAHTHSHPPLGRLSASDQEAEIETNLSCLQDLTGEVPETFAYPHGVKGTWTDDTLDVLERKGIIAAVTCVRGILGEPNFQNPLEMPRFDVNDIFSKEGLLTLPKGLSIDVDSGQVTS